MILEEKCEACDGRGKLLAGNVGNNSIIDCTECDTTGLVLTDDGLKLVEFLARLTERNEYQKEQREIEGARSE